MVIAVNLMILDPPAASQSHPNSLSNLSAICPKESSSPVNNIQGQMYNTNQ